MGRAARWPWRRPGAATVDLSAVLGDDGARTVAHESSIDALSSYRAAPQGI
ncbi:MAG: hypothetical protein U0325_34110 [Polyangiales bacterium]